MDELEFFPCCELKYGSVRGNPCANTQKPTILAVDDDEDNLLLLAYILEPFDCCLLTASDGLTALHKAQTCHPDLIFLDILMPRMDGIAVLAQLRNHSNTKAIPVIAVTALAKEGDREYLLQAGCNEYLSKPYLVEDVEGLVQRYLRLPVSIS